MSAQDALAATGHFLPLASSSAKDPLTPVPHVETTTKAPLDLTDYIDPASMERVAEGKS